MAQTIDIKAVRKLSVKQRLKLVDALFNELSQIDRLAGLLQQPHLTEAERSLVLSLRQAKIIEVGAIERFLKVEQTIPPRRKRRREPMRWC